MPAYLIDPSNLASRQDVEEVDQLTPDPVGPGTRFREVHRVLGRRRVEVTEVIVPEPGRRFEIRVVEDRRSTAGGPSSRRTAARV